eukprot:362967-Chlamydomonas_euryale.AAC.3
MHGNEQGGGALIRRWEGSTGSNNGGAAMGNRASEEGQGGGGGLLQRAAARPCRWHVGVEDVSPTHATHRVGVATMDGHPIACVMVAV